MMSDTQRADETQARVLLVEDDSANLRMTAKMLERLGYRALTAGSPNQALQLAAAHTGKLDLLITDVVMPEMNGRELAEQICSNNPRIKVLFTSGYTADVVTHRGVIEQGLHFIQKPFSMRDLAAKLRQVLDS